MRLRVTVRGLPRNQNGSMNCTICHLAQLRFPASQSGVHCRSRCKPIRTRSPVRERRPTSRPHSSPHPAGSTSPCPNARTRGRDAGCRKFKRRPCPPEPITTAIPACHTPRQSAARRPTRISTPGADSGSTTSRSSQPESPSHHVLYHAASSGGAQAEATSGASLSKPFARSARSMDAGAVTAAYSRRAPPQCGHTSTSTSNTRAAAPPTGSDALHPPGAGDAPARAAPSSAGDATYRSPPSLLLTRRARQPLPRLPPPRPTAAPPATATRQPAPTPRGRSRDAASVAASCVAGRASSAELG